MKKIFKILIIFLISFFCWGNLANASNKIDTDIDIGTALNKSGKTAENKKLGIIENKAFYKNSGNFSGQESIYYTILQIANSFRYLIFVGAGFYFLFICIRMIASGKTEEESNNFKKGIIWITVSLMIAQVAYFSADTIFNKDINPAYSYNIFQKIVEPFINLLMFLAAFFFVGVAIYTFYKLVTSNGNEEDIKNAKNTLIHSVIGFLVIAVSKVFVNRFFGTIECDDFRKEGICYIKENKGATVNIIINIISWFNGFLMVIMTIAIIYTGFQLFISRGNDDTVKKAKRSIVYIALGLLLMVVNYLIIVFLIAPADTFSDSHTIGVERKEFKN